MLSEQDIDAVTAQVAALGLRPDLRERLRDQFPNVNVTVCSDDDIVNRQPYRSHERFNLYLVGSGDGCISLTDYPGAASGVIIAEIEEGA